MTDIPGDNLEQRGTLEEISEPDPNTFTVEYWLERGLPEPDFLLGSLLSTTCRALWIGPTGIGKSNVGLGIAFAVASGKAFLHWQGRRRAKVLYIDGEMSARLHRDRLRDAVRRLGEKPANLITINRADYPDMPALNAPEGQQFIDRLIEKLRGVDFIIFDNIQALLQGSHKEDETWAPMLGWTRNLGHRNIGQLWMHHTGIANDRGYGDKTREWQFDVVALMKKPEKETPGRTLEFRLEFTKARERTPSNRAEFEPVSIWLDEDDRWQSSAPDGKADKPKKAPSPSGVKFYDALIDALAKPDTAKRRSQSANLLSVTTEQWQEECFSKGLLGRSDPANTLRAKMSKYRLELIAADWIAVRDDFVWNIKPPKEVS